MATATAPRVPTEDDLRRIAATKPLLTGDLADDWINTEAFAPLDELWSKLPDPDYETLTAIWREEVGRVAPYVEGIMRETAVRAGVRFGFEHPEAAANVDEDAS